MPYDFSVILFLQIIRVIFALLVAWMPVLKLIRRLWKFPTPAVMEIQ